MYMGRYTLSLNIRFCIAEINGAAVNDSSKMQSKETSQLLNELFEDKKPSQSHSSESGKLHKDTVTVRMLEILNTKQSITFTSIVPKSVFSLVFDTT